MPEKELEDEVAPLLELKRKYRQDCVKLESDLQTRLREELNKRKRESTAEYVDMLVEMVVAPFADRLKKLLMEVLTE